MPELPEVETITEDLRTVMMGAAIVSVETTPSRVYRTERERIEEVLPGQVIAKVSRRGKYILCELSPSGEKLMFHLGMTGHIRATYPEVPVEKFTFLRVLLDSGREIRFDDMRHFGRILLGKEEDLIEKRLYPKLGQEPLSPSFTVEFLKTAVSQSGERIKSFLLSQNRVAGLGNIYVDESLFRAGIHPKRAANSLTEREVQALRSAIRVVLSDAIRDRGSSIANYSDIWDAKGKAQENLYVYGREEQKCRLCQGRIEKIKVSSRGTYFCPVCQPLVPS